MDIGQRIRIWCKRKPNGELYFPRCVLAHLVEILNDDIHHLTGEEVHRIKKIFR